MHIQNQYSTESQLIDIDQTGNLYVTNLVQLLSLRDIETGEHTRRVSVQALKLAKILSLPEREQTHIWRGAMLHDVGKIGIPDNILHKMGRFTRAEQDVMRMHPVYAYQLLRNNPYLRPALDIPYCHHERWDGSGYPRGIAGKDIPLPARLFAVVDVWDAMLSNRPYHSAYTFEQAGEYLLEQSGKLFDPEIVDMFVKSRLFTVNRLWTVQMVTD